MAKRLRKRRSSINNDWHDRADEALEAARSMPPGAERNMALKAAGKLRNAADMYALFFNREGSATKPTASVGLNTENTRFQLTPKG